MKIKKNVALSDSGFLFNSSTGDSYSVNPTGQFILNLLQEDRSEETIIKAVIDEFAIDKDTIEKDLYDFKNFLQSYKLVE